MLAVDLIESDNGDMLVLEVNSYPAFANGTMAAVPHELYDLLLTELFRHVIAPVIGDQVEFTS